MIKGFIKWKKHHQIEAFAASLFVVVLALIALCFSVLFRTEQEDKELMATQAIYVSDFTTSLSGVSGTIEHVYVNANHTKCGVLVRFDDPSRMSQDASDYQMFIRGFDVTKGAYAVRTGTRPKGGYCIFGTAGYALIYLSDSSGFGRQALECIVRSNNTLYAATEGQTTTEMRDLQQADGSYANYDQYRVIFNPNAEEAAVVDFLDDLDPEALYQQAVVDSYEEGIRDTLQDDISEMNTMMHAVLSYRENLDSMDVRVPALPSELSGEVFDNEEIGGKTVLTYQPGSVMARGVDFDWQHTTLQEGSFLTDSLLGTQTPVQFFATLDAASDERSEGMQELYGTWHMKSGLEIKQDESSDFSDMAVVSTNITNYVSAVNSYYSLKQKYQCTDMVSYLKLEYNMKNAGNNVSGNFSDDVITVW